MMQALQMWRLLCSAGLQRERRPAGRGRFQSLRHEVRDSGRQVLLADTVSFGLISDHGACDLVQRRQAQEPGQLEGQVQPDLHAAVGSKLAGKAACILRVRTSGCNQADRCSERVTSGTSARC